MWIPSSTARRMVIPAVPVTNNRYLRLNRYARSRERVRWVNRLRMATRTLYGPCEVARGGRSGRLRGLKGPRMRVLIRVVRKRFQDEDNAVGSLKPVLDALRTLRWIVDDSTRWLDFCSEQVRLPRGEAPYTDIHLDKALDRPGARTKGRV
jgi:hypothetical protein